MSTKVRSKSLTVRVRMPKKSLKNLLISVSRRITEVYLEPGGKVMILGVLQN